MASRYLEDMGRLLRREHRTYASSADTSLLRGAVRNYRGGYALEIGFGNGSVVEELAKNFEFVAGTDLVLSREASRPIRASCDLVLADRAGCFRSSVFDLVAFNPPYLPSGAIEDIAVDGGSGGIEVPLMFLDEALRVLRPGGRILLVLSSEGDLDTFQENCLSRNLLLKVVGGRDLFFEILSVYEVKRAGY